MVERSISLRPAFQVTRVVDGRVREFPDTRFLFFLTVRFALAA